LSLVVFWLLLGGMVSNRAFKVEAFSGEVRKLRACSGDARGSSAPESAHVTWDFSEWLGILREPRFPASRALRPLDKAKVTKSVLWEITGPFSFGSNDRNGFVHMLTETFQRDTGDQASFGMSFA
jgi:hypothetical protein